MPSSSSSPAALHGVRTARIPPSIRSIPASETTPDPNSTRPTPTSFSRAATRHPHALRPSPDVAAANPSYRPRSPLPPPQHQSPQRSASPTYSARREQRPCTPIPIIDKVDSKPKSIAGTVKSRAHSRLVSFGRIRPRGVHLPAERDTLDSEPLSPVEPLPTLPTLPRQSLAGSHKRSEPSTASYHSSETTLSDEKYYDTKSFEESRQQPIARGTQRNSSAEQRAKLDEYPVDPTEQYHRLVASRSRMMHQTSSRLLRMTEDDRPFTRVSDTFPCIRAQVPAVRCSSLHLRNMGAMEVIKVSAAIAHPRLRRTVSRTSSFQCLLFSSGIGRPDSHSLHHFPCNI